MKIPLSLFMVCPSKHPVKREVICRGEGLSFEHFLPWIWKIMLSYQDKEDHEKDDLLPHDTNFSKGYYNKKVN